jgi:hypothetical protein
MPNFGFPFGEGPFGGFPNPMMQQMVSILDIHTRELLLRAELPRTQTLYTLEMPLLFDIALGPAVLTESLRN